jgi:hypothetical protein
MRRCFLHKQANLLHCINPSLFQQALDCRLKQMRAVTVPDWHTDTIKFKLVVQVSVALVQAYFLQQDDQKRALFSAKLHLRSIIKKAEENFGGSEDFALLQKTLADVEAREKAIAGSTSS